MTIGPQGKDEAGRVKAVDSWSGLPWQKGLVSQCSKVARSNPLNILVGRGVTVRVHVHHHQRVSVLALVSTALTACSGFVGEVIGIGSGLGSHCEVVTG